MEKYAYTQRLNWKDITSHDFSAGEPEKRGFLSEYAHRKPVHEPLPAFLGGHRQRGAGISPEHRWVPYFIHNHGWSLYETMQMYLPNDVKEYILNKDRRVL